MKFLHLKNKSEFFSLVLLILALLFTGLTAAELMLIAGGNNRNLPITAQMQDQIRNDKQASQRYLEQYQQAAEQLARNNNFILPVQAEPPGDCTAIFGDEAYFGDRWIRVGDTLGDAKVMDVGPTAVTLQWQGQRITRSPSLFVAATRKRILENQITGNPQSNREEMYRITEERLQRLVREGKITKEDAARTMDELRNKSGIRKN